MNPEEAQAKYKQQWPELNEALQAAKLRGVAAETKRCRQRLSALSLECNARFQLDEVPAEPTELEGLQARIAALEQRQNG